MRVPGFGQRNPASATALPVAAGSGAAATAVGGVATAGLGLREGPGAGADAGFADPAGAGAAGRTGIAGVGAGGVPAICAGGAERSAPGELPEAAGSPKITSAWCLLSIVQVGNLERRLCPSRSLPWIGTTLGDVVDDLAS